jgi:AraC-like DNA-binding protein
MEGRAIQQVGKSWHGGAHERKALPHSILGRSEACYLVNSCNKEHKAMTRTTHFAPKPGKLSMAPGMGATPVISVTALAGISAVVRHTFGERILRCANQAAMLDIEAIEDQDCFIPHGTMTTFVDTVARLAGEKNLGLMLAPHLTIANYGCWGAYVLSAHTLGEAIERAIATLGFHTKGDRLAPSFINGRMRLSYFSAAKAQDGYSHVACGVAGVIVSLCKFYLSDDWRPERTELDIPRPDRSGIFEDAFECPVYFDAAQVAVLLDTERLSEASKNYTAGSPVTVEDLARARIECSTLNGLRDVIAQQIWSQVLTGQASIESAARSVNISVRSLQRELNREGTDFRTMVNSMRTRRAIELLRNGGTSVTAVSMALGYSSPAHFSRAFHRATGRNPRDFRPRKGLLSNTM